ncbi:hypothetical protein CASFOL_003702 [Castilleja foliolosa]|uniref:LOW protein: ammonium transporter 1-like protein n=1 Tax=Castilleja foliolosa TaxID=1961234 RepID=A0ABD3EIB2_9LAMI
MATASLSAFHLLPPSKFSSINAHNFSQNSFHIPSSLIHTTQKSKSLKLISFALTESSDSPKSLDREPQVLLKQLADCFVLPEDYFRQLPRDIRLDSHRRDLYCAESLTILLFSMLKLNDAAFDLSNGPVKDECGEELGETLLNISQAWENGDASTSASLVSKLPLIVGSLTGNNKSALGKRLLSASGRFQSMGQYGQGELQKIAKVMNQTGKLLSASPVTIVADGEAKQEIKVLKFGDLQVELTPDKAYIGAVIAVIFGILSWQVSQGIQSIPESSLEYANDNALRLAKSLRVALLAVFYSSTILCAFSTIGLILLGGQLKSKGK